MRFDGFPPGAFSWFAGLETDNSRAYFQEMRDVYERDVRGPLEALLDELADEFGTGVRMFRQNRDVRFSADKSPYKTTTYGLVEGSAGTEAGFYAQVSARGLFAGTGYHVFASDQLEAYRAAVLDDGAGTQLERLFAELESSGVELFGEALKTAPRGVPRDHPRVRLLRHKSLFCGSARSAGGDGIPRERALEHVGSIWRRGRALNAWLDEHVGPSRVPPDQRQPRGRPAA